MEDVPDIPERCRTCPAITPHQEEQARVSVGQRKVNLLWERTQAAIAIFVVVATLSIGGWLAIVGGKEIPTIFSVAFGTVVGFYFSRTNHSSIGGVGPIKPDDNNRRGE